ncbi:hypothetical protein ACLX1H_009960 [Fusarium chlamydosporum]
MTPDAHRPRDSSIDFAADIDLLAGLWQEAPFARLPTDAPPEVKAAVQNVENPARVYAIHQASRRHGFQLLVERYITQLRSGCDNVNCATPTCFTCRRRLAGKAPIRRYNTTSARTLAIYLASQDDPEKGLCPFLRKSPEPPAALSNLIFSTRPSSPPHPDDKRANVATSPGVRKSQAARPRPTSSASQDSIHSAKRASRSTDGSSVSWVHVTEGPVNKDHRSFAANLFGTVAFKMLEWLTPKGVAAMSEKLGSLEVTDSRASATDTDTLQESSSLTSTSTDLEMHKVLSHESSAPRSIKTSDQSQQTDWDEPPFPTKSCRSRHGSTHKSQSNATPKPRKRSSDSNDFTRGEDGNKVTQLPQGNGHLREKSLRPRSSKYAAVPNMREIPSKPGLFENVTKPAAEPVLSSPPLTSRHNAVNEAKSKSDGSDQGARNDILSQETSRSEAESEAVAFHGSDSILPQALSKLDVDLVNFICDVYESDGTSEASLTPTSKMHYRYPQPVDQREGLRRHPASRTARSRKQWLHFNEQTIFYVLTDPQAVVQSFTQGHKLYDSQTLWNLLLLGDVQFRVDYLSERLDSIEMPVEWLSFKSTRWRKHILDYPYIFSPETLVSFFRSINFARMSRMYEESSSLKTRMSAIVDPGSLITNPHHKMVLQDLLRTASSKYLVLEVGRQNVARDAFDQLWRRERRELLRPLKVHLGENSGEEGFDSGGVQQEFFRLAIAECLDPGFGAFTVDERTRMAWFAPGSLTEEWKYELVGLLMSLALYNGLTLPVTFPKALYRKLLGKPVEELHHIADGWPDLASGLTTLLEWDEKNGLIEDIFARTYEFSVSSLGTIVTREMRPNDDTTWPNAASSLADIEPPHMDNSDDAPLVTNDNRDDYIIDYIRYLTDVSIRRQYLAFERGFASCLDKKSLSLLCPSTLQSLVEGVQEIDIGELKRYARYVGWDPSHRTIKDFWSIVKRYDEDMKQRLLEFVTSSDRVPVGGMKNLQFVIQKNA